MAQWPRNIQDILTIMDDCIRAQQDEALTLRALADRLGYSEYYTSRRFRALAGMTLRDYLRLRRLAFALRDVRDTDAGILDIAVQYGFSSNEAFARVQEGLRREPQRLPGRARPRRAPDHPAAVRLLSDGRSRRSERDTKRGRGQDLFRAHPGAQISAHPQL